MGRQKKITDKIKAFFLDNKVVKIVGVLIAALILFLFFKRKSKNTDSAGNGHTGNQNLTDVARAISIHLGTNKELAWWEKWSENERAVYLLLEDMTLSQFRKVANAYRAVFTDHRDLKADLLRLMGNYVDKLDHLLVTESRPVGSVAAVDPPEIKITLDLEEGQQVKKISRYSPIGFGDPAGGRDFEAKPPKKIKRKKRLLGKPQLLKNLIKSNE